MRVARSPHRAPAPRSGPSRVLTGLECWTAVVLCLATPSLAWTPDAQLVIATEGAKLAPPDFYRQIERHEAEFRAGVLEPFEENEPRRHYKNVDGGGILDEVIEAETRRAISMIENHEAFERIVRQAGRIAYFVALANNPLNTASADQYESQYFADYARYVQSAAPRLPVIFYGLDQHLEKGDFDSFVDGILERGRTLYPSIGSEYRRIGKLPGSQWFDDRSTAFGVSSVAYSRAISDVALVLRFAWIQAGGADERPAPREEDGRLLKVEKTVLGARGEETPQREPRRGSSPARPGQLPR